MGKPNCACHTLIRSYTAHTAHTAHSTRKCTIESGRCNVWSVDWCAMSDGSHSKSIVSASISTRKCVRTRAILRNEIQKVEYGTRLVRQKFIAVTIPHSAIEKLNSRASRVCIQSFLVVLRMCRVCTVCVCVYRVWGQCPMRTM